jgi:hypothetical protein
MVAMPYKFLQENDDSKSTEPISDLAAQIVQAAPSTEIHLEPQSPSDSALIIKNGASSLQSVRDTARRLSSKLL